MNILQINASDNPVGGAARVMLDLTEILEKKGHEVSVFSGTHYSIKNNFKQIKKNIFLKYLSYFFANDIDFFKTDYILNTEEFKKADIVHCHNLHGWYFNLNTFRKMSKIKPVVWTLHDMWSITPHCCHPFQDDKIVEGFYQCASKDIYPNLLWHNENKLMKRKKEIYNNSIFSIVSPSLWLENKLKNSVLKNFDTHIIYNGVNTEIFKKNNKLESRKELELPEDKKIVLFLVGGGYDRYIFKGGKYLEYLANAYKDVQSIVFLCIGLSDLPSSSKKENIIYVDKVNESEIMAKYYSASDVFLFTSLAENFPIVILEAMSCGMPILSFDIGGVKEVIIHKNNGYVVKYKDEDDLLSGLDYLLSLSQNSLDSICKDSISKIDNYFSLDKMYQNYSDLYKTLISKFF